MFLASLCTQNQSLFAEVRTGPRSSFWFHVKYYWCSIVNFITFNLCNKSSALNIENSKLQTSSLYYWKVPTILKCIVLIFRTSAHEHVLSKGANWCGGRTGNFRSCTWYIVIFQDLIINLVQCISCSCTLAYCIAISIKKRS